MRKSKRAPKDHIKPIEVLVKVIRMPPTRILASPSNKIITLKRVHEDIDGSLADEQCISSIASSGKHGRHCKESGDDVQCLVEALKQRPWLACHDSEISLAEESESEKTSATSSSLPVGVIRGCPKCSVCQKVNARWRPEAACRPSIEDAPVYFPLEEEFKDPLKYISSIRAEAEQYGICRIVPPQSWRPPCPLRHSEKWETLTFSTRVQQVHKLQVREVCSKRNEQMRKKRRGRSGRRGRRMGSRSVHCSDALERITCQAQDNNDKFGFEPGPKFTLAGFEKYAQQFKEEYFRMLDYPKNSHTDVKNSGEPSVENIEGEYWRIVEQATEQIEVLYGADVDTGVFGSGFVKRKEGIEPSQYESCGWNLNNIARLPGSVLAFEEGDISGVLVPWLYVGMCFSSFCWHVEDHHFYSLNYMHWGSPKVWYGVPSSASTKLEEAMKKHLPDLFDEQPDLLHKLVTQLSPSILKKEGVPVYRAVQKTGEFIITFPRSYHAGFNCGFNCAEAVNVAPVDWLPYGQSAVELYREQGRKTSISHDKLLLRFVMQILNLQGLDLKWDMERNQLLDLWFRSSDQLMILINTIKMRVDLEQARRAQLCDLKHLRRMGNEFDATCERECVVCHYDLHLSAIGCECCPNRYTCLEHMDRLCACEPTKRYALYRYSIPELESMVLDLERQQWSNSRIRMNGTSKKVEGINGTHSSILGSATTIDNIATTPKCGMFVHKEETNSRMMNISKVEVIDETHSSILGANTIIDNNTKCGLFMHKEEINPRDSLECDVIRETSLLITKKHMEPPNFFDLNSVGRIENSNDGEEDKSSCDMMNQLLSVGFVADTSLSRTEQNFVNLNSIETIEIPDERETSLQEEVDIYEDDCGILEFFKHPSLFQEQQSKTERELMIFDEDVYEEVGSFLKDRNYKSPNGQPVDVLMSNFSSNLSSEGLIGDQMDLPKGSGKMLSLSLGQSLVKPSLDIEASQATQKNRPSFSPKLKALNEVELLNVGKLVLKKPWFNTNAIFPAGFKSRVRYNSTLDPFQKCFYESEIIDSGQDEPLFKVTMQGQPSVVYIHTSADECWKMVQDSVNSAMYLHLRKKNLPVLQSLEYIQGLDLFGFATPYIRKAIELLDQQHQCLEYWAGREDALKDPYPKQSLNDNRLLSRETRNIPLQNMEDYEHNLSDEIVGRPMGRSVQSPSNASGCIHPPKTKLYATLREMFKKGTSKELLVLHRLFVSQKGDCEWREGYKALQDELASL